MRCDINRESAYFTRIKNKLICLIFYLEYYLFIFYELVPFLYGCVKFTFVSRLQACLIFNIDKLTRIKVFTYYTT